MQCPKCQGNTYDNRAENDARLAKGEKMRPDYKCKNKDCDGVVWRPKEGWGAAAPAPVAAAPRAASPVAKQPFSAGGPIPGLDDGSAPLPHEKLDGIFRVYSVCFKQAHKEAVGAFGNDVSDTTVAAMSATLLIAAQKAGVC